MSSLLYNIIRNEVQMMARLICRIRDLRKYKELTQENLADELGISRQALIALEQGKSLPSLGLAMEIADFFERDLEEIFNDDFGRSLPTQISAPSDLFISDKGKNIIVIIAVNNISPKDINIELTENNLLIFGKASIKKEADDKNFQYQSESVSSFSRAIPLSVKINPDKTKAEFERGILRITLPKIEEKRRRLQIKIKNR